MLDAVGVISNTKFRSFAQVNIDGPCKSCSLSESKFKEALSKEDLEACRFFATKHLIRIFPDWYRVDSSNFDPQKAWEAGVQVVALNHQGTKHFHKRINHRVLWLNAGKFRANFSCGFVLKPPHIMCEDVASGSVFLTVTVLGSSGWEGFSKDQLGRGSAVSLELAGAETDRRIVRTSVCRGSRLSKLRPCWMESFGFSITDVNLAVLIFSCLDPNDEHLFGQYAFPVQEVRNGWRSVPLLGDDGDEQVGRPALLCHFETSNLLHLS